MDDEASDDEFSLNPGARAGAGVEDEDDEAPALRAALHFSVGEICSAEEGKLPMTGGAVSTLAEVGMHHTCCSAGERCRQNVFRGRRATVCFSNFQKRLRVTEDNTTLDRWISTVRLDTTLPHLAANRRYFYRKRYVCAAAFALSFASLAMLAFREYGHVFACCSRRHARVTRKRAQVSVYEIAVPAPTNICI